MHKRVSDFPVSESMNGFGLLLAELHKKERSACAKRSFLAGAVRFELTTKVLEIDVKTHKTLEKSFP